VGLRLGELGAGRLQRRLVLVLLDHEQHLATLNLGALLEPHLLENALDSSPDLDGGNALRLGHELGGDLDAALLDLGDDDGGWGWRRGLLGRGGVSLLASGDRDQQGDTGQAAAPRRPGLRPSWRKHGSGLPAQMGLHQFSGNPTPRRRGRLERTVVITASREKWDLGPTPAHGGAAGIRKRSAARAGPLLRERQREREGRAAVRIVLCPQPTTVSLDQGPGDRESHPEALRLRRVERLEDQRQLALGDPAATVAHRDAYDAVGADAGRDGEATIVAGPHGIEAIHDQVEDDLLELNAIGEDHGQSGLELEIDGHPPGGRVAPYQAAHVL